MGLCSPRGKDRKSHWGGIPNTQIYFSLNVPIPSRAAAHSGLISTRFTFKEGILFWWEAVKGARPTDTEARAAPGMKTVQQLLTVICACHNFSSLHPVWEDGGVWDCVCSMSCLSPAWTERRSAAAVWWEESCEAGQGKQWFLWGKLCSKGSQSEGDAACIPTTPAQSPRPTALI